jgi:hypothetical protein
MGPRFESAFFASFLCRFGQRNDAPPRAVANSDKEVSKPKQTTSAESNNPASTQTLTANRKRSAKAQTAQMSAHGVRPCNTATKKPCFCKSTCGTMRQ